jgi:hypothetical protein
VLSAGVILCVIAAAALVPLLDQSLLESLAENTDCNGRPCTPDEVRGVLTGVAIGSGALGGALVVAGLVQAVRRGGAGPDLTDLERSAADGQQDRMEAVARLDEAYGRGEVGEQDYLRMRERLMRPDR